MNYKHTVTLLLLLTLQFSSFAQQTHVLDVKKSKILWNTGNAMGGHFGELLFQSGSLTFSAVGTPTVGSFSMDMNSIQSLDRKIKAENDKTVATLRTVEFFDVKNYPSATINIKKINRIGASPNYSVAGDLTIKGITHPIEFMATINNLGNTSKITANLDILRHKWNIDYDPKKNSMDFLSGIKQKIAGDEIHISLDLSLVNK